MIEDLIRPHLRAFRPYVSARSEGLQARIYLDANELSLGSPVGFEGQSLNRYPDPYQQRLRETIAGLEDVEADAIFVGVGSDEIIDLLVRLMCEPGKENVVILEPTYGVYRVAADMNAVEVLAVELSDRFQIDIEKTLAAIRATTKLLFCCSPNNPTGNLLDHEKLLCLCKSFEGVVVVDEAYVEFSGDESMTRYVRSTENLVVMRTFSKAWGLAGIRLGYAIASPTLVTYLLRIKSPYNISTVTSTLALMALENDGFVREAATAVISERDRLARALGKLDIVEHVYPSQANFLLARFKDAERAFLALLEKEIAVRRRAESRLLGCLRITVGTSEQNQLLVDTLSELQG